MGYFEDIEPFVRGFVRSQHRLIFSPEECIVFRNVKQKKTAHMFEKPRGLWYMMGTEWMEYCQENEIPHFVEGRNIHKLALNTKKMLVIQTEAEMEAFVDEYAQQGVQDASIKWHKVAKKYCGIEIAPYQFAKRLEPRYKWYYGWDVASGVIWNEKAIKGISTIYRHDTRFSKPTKVVEEIKSVESTKAVEPQMSPRLTFDRSKSNQSLRELVYPDKESKQRNAFAMGTASSIMGKDSFAMGSAKWSGVSVKNKRRERHLFSSSDSFDSSTSSEISSESSPSSPSTYSDFPENEDILE